MFHVDIITYNSAVINRMQSIWGQVFDSQTDGSGFDRINLICTPLLKGSVVVRATSQQAMQPDV